jgi:DUF2938 family protein
MNQTIELLLRTVLIGIGGSAAMDLWALVLKYCFGVRSVDYGLFGRWIGHLIDGQSGALMKVQQELMRHASIQTTINIYGAAMSETKRRANTAVVRMVPLNVHLLDTRPKMTLILKVMAERVGFEPTIRFPVYTLSKRAPSATRPSLRGEKPK